MIRTSTLFILCFILFCSLQNQLAIQIPLTSFQTNDQFTRIRISITGGSPPYNLFYSQIPTNWDQIKNTLYFRSQILSISRKYPVKLIVNDSQQNNLNATLVIQIRNNEVSISETVFPYSQQFEDQFFNQEGFSGKPELRTIQILQSLDLQPLPNIQIVQRTEQESEGIISVPGSGISNIIQTLMVQDQVRIASQIEQAQGVIGNQTTEDRTMHSMEQIYNELPMTKELDQIILQRDALEIFKIIQSVIIQQNLSCNEKIYYISDFFGRIQSALKMKIFTRDQLQNLIEGARAQIERLQFEINFIQDQIQKISVQSQQQLLFNQINTLQEAYDLFNQNFQKLQVENENLQNTKNQLIQQEKNINQKNAQIENKNQELSQVIADEQRLDIELNNARDRQVEIEEQIQGIQSQIRGINFELILIRNNIERAQFVVSELQIRSQGLEGDEVNQNSQQLEQARRDLQDLRNRFTQQQNKINGKNSQFQNKRQQLSNTITDIQRLKNEYDNARSRLFQINQEIDSLQVQIRDINFQINLLNSNQERLQSIISQLEIQSQQLKEEYEEIQNQIQITKASIKQSIKQQAQFYQLNQINLNQKIVQQNKIALRQLRILQNFIQVLQGTIPNIEDQLNRIYYQCFQVQNIQTSGQNGKIGYVLVQQQFINYLKFTYGAQVNAGFITSQNSQISLIPSYILQQQWIQAFGEPYQEDVVANTDQFSFNNDFNCLNPSTLQNGSGKILSIQKNVIKLQKQNQEDQQIILTFSPCSRIQSSSRLPQKEQTIYWKGNTNKDGQIQVYISTSV